MKEDIITENSNEEIQKPKKKQSALLIVLILVIFVIGSSVVTAIHYKNLIDIKEESIKSLEKEIKIHEENTELLKKEIKNSKEQTSKFLELLDKQKALAEEKLVRDKKNYEKLVKWVYQNSSKISKKTAEEIVSRSLETNFPLMHLAIMKTESNFDPTSISNKGASGIGQQMPKDYKEPLIEAGIISEWRDIFDIAQGVKATEFAWNDKFKLGKGNILESLKLYYGENDKSYINQVLIDYHYLVYLCNFNGLEEQEENKIRETIK